MNSLILYAVSCFVKILPPTRCFGLKRELYRLAGAKIGKNVRISSSATIIGSGNLTIGDDTWIGHEVMILCSSNVSIGKECDIAPRVYIGTGTHLITPDESRIGNTETSKNISIGNGCWLCVNCSVLPGVDIGDKVVVAAGAVVTKSVGKKCMVAGVPASIKKQL